MVTAGLQIHQCSGSREGKDKNMEESIPTFFKAQINFTPAGIGKDFVIWPHLTAGNAGKCNVSGIQVLGYNYFSKGFHEQLLVSNSM